VARILRLPPAWAGGRTRKARPGVEAEIVSILKPRWVDRVIDVTVTGQDPADLRLTWQIDQTNGAIPTSSHAWSSATGSSSSPPVAGSCGHAGQPSPQPADPARDRRARDGLVNACREIVKELAIYKRERTVGLSLPAYAETRSSSGRHWWSSA
jgi:hypothetical protein